MAHEEWSKKTGIEKTRHAPISKAPRFTDEKDNLIRRDMSPGPGTGIQLTSFLLPDIHRVYTCKNAEGYLQNPNFPKYNRI